MANSKPEITKKFLLKYFLKFVFVHSKIFFLIGKNMISRETPDIEYLSLGSSHP